jgi:hypothetical protein
MPGGQAAGKIKAYSFAVDGSSGTSGCAITLGCSVGQGNIVVSAPGTPTYVAAGYVNVGWQRYADQFIMPVAGEIAYESLDGQLADDDGADFLHGRASDFVLHLTSGPGLAAQEAAMKGSASINSGLQYTAPDTTTVFDRLNVQQTTFELEMRPVTGGPFQTEYLPAVSLLMVPKTIDLEAT